MSHADVDNLLRDVSKYYVTFYRAKDQFSVDHAKQILLSVFCFCPQCLMNTEFHATVRAVIIIKKSDTRNIWIKHAARHPAAY